LRKSPLYIENLRYSRNKIFNVKSL